MDSYERGPNAAKITRRIDVAVTAARRWSPRCLCCAADSGEGSLALFANSLSVRASLVGSDGFAVERDEPQRRDSVAGQTVPPPERGDHRLGRQRLDEILRVVSASGSPRLIERHRSGRFRSVQPLSGRRANSEVCERLRPQWVRNEDHFSELTDEIIERILRGLCRASESGLGQCTGEGD